MFRYRTPDLERLHLAMASEAELITVLGPGGSGKTTLVRQLEDSLFVDLTACRTAADAEGALERAAGPDLAKVDQWVVLDNCEQVEGLAPRVADWLGHVRIVATSRAPLQLRVEQRLRLDGISDADAADLFCRRAALQGVEVTPDQALPIVARLDGSPLAVELCAGRVAALGIEGLAGLMDAPLKVLSDRKADRPERHTSLARTLQWSWDLLSPDARAVLPQIALFAGAFSLKDCDWVTSDAWIGDVLEELVEASLLETPGRAGAGRFRILETVGAFARQHTPPEARQRFRAALLERAPRPGDVEEAVLAFRAALEDAPDEAVRIASWIDPVLTRVGPLGLRLEVIGTAQALQPGSKHLRIRLAHAEMSRGGVERAEELLDGLERDPDLALRSEALAAAARLASNLHDMARARELWEQVRQLAEDQGDVDGMARAIAKRSNFDKGLGRVEDARRGIEEALALARQRGDRAGEALGLAHLGTMAHDRGDLEAADRFMAQAGVAFSEQGQALHAADLLATRGTVALERGDFEAAHRGIEAAIAAHAERGSPRWLGWYTVLLATVQALQGDLAAADASVRSVISSLREYGLAGSSEVAVLTAAVITEDPTLATVWMDEVSARVQTLPSSPVLQAALRVAAARGDLEALRALREELSLPGDGHPPVLRWASEVRVLLQLAESRAAVTDVVYGDGWFQLPDGTEVDLRTRGALRRILAALVDARGGEGLSMDDVFEAGWPGQEIHPDAAGNRVYTSIAALRKMGLSDVLVRHDDGYRLIPWSEAGVEP